MGYSPRGRWGRKELDLTEGLTLTFHFHAHTGVMFPPGEKKAGQPGLDVGAEWMTVIDLQEPQRKKYLFLLYFLELYFYCGVDSVCCIYFFWTNFGKPGMLPVTNQS